MPRPEKPCATCEMLRGQLAALRAEVEGMREVCEAAVEVEDCSHRCSEPLAWGDAYEKLIDAARRLAAARGEKA